MTSPQFQGFQKGDVIFPYKGKTYYLRLTLGALSEICMHLKISSPAELISVIHEKDIDKLSIIFSSLSRPSHRKTIRYSDLDLSMAMPVLAEIFEIAFEPIHTGEPMTECSYD